MWARVALRYWLRVAYCRHSKNLLPNNQATNLTKFTVISYGAASGVRYYIRAACYVLAITPSPLCPPPILVAGRLSSRVTSISTTHPTRIPPQSSEPAKPT